MDKLIVNGTANLKGSINIYGAKNAALPIMACSLLSDQNLKLNNLPNVEDINSMKKLLYNFGSNIITKKRSIIIKNNRVKNKLADYDLVRKMRASILVLGPLLSRFKEAKISMPGGCSIGTRPIDLHLFALSKLGAKFKYKDGYVIGKVNGTLNGASIVFPRKSVGATENSIMAAVLAKGNTEIINAAKEPEVFDLCNCLNSMGATITGHGTSKIKIKGVEKLYSSNHNIISDRIVAGTFIIAAILLNKTFIIRNFNTQNLDSLFNVLEKMGAQMKIKSNSVKIFPSRPLKGITLTTKPYPGFPTDLQAQIMTLMSVANGKSQIKENIFENRFMHVPELNRLGADIKIKNDVAYINGNRQFKGAQVMASDLRASVSLVLAGLSAYGKTTINRVYHLDRGYEKIEKTLGKCGPKIKRLT
ncbi:MAG: UDP-N-acetylglucosamine 1-carboxyvinyltransferase [Alphaproteobacteria bacterium MarineAlpha5_Bin9]|nr:MAG: UDP-N-acetylglucosamine 1-carboxyvinyltransferase [Alphaproteobacteria bacterium MarineAlpha5_Bin9]|tara:strand:+ start:394 stop:1647 length:1254 start_codon:yes stop_codon:yes gene_type:complete